LIGRLIKHRYDVLERLGEGTFFQVFKTRDRTTGRIVVVKTLQPLFARDAAFCRALRASSSIIGLNHPNIAALYEVLEEDDAPMLVTEFVRGMNLKERIRRLAPFTLAVAVDFAIAIAEALKAAHHAGIVHGDLRPHNVQVSPEGAVKVTDFGLAQALAASQQAFASNLARAVYYQAPEVEEGHPASIPSDLYALGAMLYEMLTGSVPFLGETPSAVASKRQSEPTPSPRHLNPGVPRSVEGIVLKALQKRPEQRYRSAADLLNDLKSVRDALRFGKSLSWTPMDSEPVTVAPKSAPEAAVVAPTTAPSPAKERESTAVRRGAPTPLEPDAPVEGAARMSATRASDDRISPLLKFALATVIFIILGTVLAGVSFWLATFKPPEEQKFPNLVGMKIEEARLAAEKANVRLMEHEEFNEEREPGVIYRADWEPGRPIRPGRSVNVWISKGSRMVWVPKVLQMPGQEAEAKLKEAGLTLGAVDRRYDDKIPYDYVIAQNPRSGKRVRRGEPVNLILSDGAKPQEDLPPDQNQSRGGSKESGVSPPDPEETRPRNYNLNVRVKGAGQGPRQVRIELEDALGKRTLIDEQHNEGDLISQKVEVYGDRVIVRVYYDDNPIPVLEETKIIPRGRP
jgi:serine/threonine protein kinase